MSQYLYVGVVREFISFVKTLEPPFARLETLLTRHPFGHSLDLLPRNRIALLGQPFQKLAFHIHVSDFSPSSGSPITSLPPATDIIDRNIVFFCHFDHGHKFGFVYNLFLEFLAKNVIFATFIFLFLFVFGDNFLCPHPSLMPVLGLSIDLSNRALVRVIPFYLLLLDLVLFCFQLQE